MTEQEAIEIIRTEKACVERNIKHGCNRDCFHCDLLKPDIEILTGYNTAISALEEIQQYRALGTVEQCQKSIEIVKAMIKRNITPEIIEEYVKFEDECVRKGFSFNSLLEAREKQIALKPVRVIVWAHDATDGCPVCKRAFYNRESFCPQCGQAIDWS